MPNPGYTRGASRRWVEGQRAIIFTAQPKNASGALMKAQVFLYNIDTKVLEQLTNDRTSKDGAFMWRAPEFGNEYVFLTISAANKILIYRKIDANGTGEMKWTVIKTISTPADMLYIWSPEPFVHNGKSYIFMVLAAKTDFTSFKTPTQLALSGIDPNALDFRLLTNDFTNLRVRTDPEVFVNASGPFIYYNRLFPRTATRPPINEGTYRVDTGLGPVTTY